MEIQRNYSQRQHWNFSHCKTDHCYLTMLPSRLKKESLKSRHIDSRATVFCCFLGSVLIFGSLLVLISASFLNPAWASGFYMQVSNSIAYTHKVSSLLEIRLKKWLINGKGKFWVYAFHVIRQHIITRENFVTFDTIYSIGICNSNKIMRNVRWWRWE